MKKNYAFGLLLAGASMWGQVGINTQNPQATLDVAGDLIVRQIDAAATAPSYKFLVQNPHSQHIESLVSGPGSGMFAAGAVTKVSRTNTLKLTEPGLVADWQVVKFKADDIVLDASALFSPSGHFYEVPAHGLYRVSYEFRYGFGVILSATDDLGGIPTIAILRSNGGNYSVLEQRRFDGVNEPNSASMVITSGTIDTVYRLMAGDKLSFAIDAGGLELRLLGISHASAVMYKIAD